MASKFSASLPDPPIGVELISLSLGGFIVALAAIGAMVALLNAFAATLSGLCLLFAAAELPVPLSLWRQQRQFRRVRLDEANAGPVQLRGTIQVRELTLSPSSGRLAVWVRLKLEEEWTDDEGPRQKTHLDETASNDFFLLDTLGRTTHVDASEAHIVGMPEAGWPTTASSHFSASLVDYLRSALPAYDERLAPLGTMLRLEEQCLRAGDAIAVVGVVQTTGAERRLSATQIFLLPYAAPSFGSVVAAVAAAVVIAAVAALIGK